MAKAAKVTEAVVPLRTAPVGEVRTTITPPNLRVAEVTLRGTAPYVQHRFFKKGDIIKTQEAGSTAKSKRKHPPRNFQKDYEESLHRSTEGWFGIPASAFRNAMIDSCRLVGFKMTHAKLSIFVMPDGLDPDGYPLVRLDGTPQRHDAYARNENGSVDIRARPMFRVWSCKLRIRFDADQFTLEDVMNLLERAGQQVGIGEGRPNSPNSFGLGWGTFTTVEEERA